MRPGRATIVAAWGWLLAVTAAAADPILELAGALEFPGEVAAEGPPIGGVSGLARIAGDDWVAVMDTGDGLVTFRLDLSAAGAPLAIRDPRVVPLTARHDFEDVALCPPSLAAAIAAGPRADRGTSLFPQAAATADRRQPRDQPSPWTRAMDRFVHGQEAAGPWVLLCEEDTPAVHLAAVGSGELIGLVPLPAILGSRRPNLGLESVAIDPVRSRVWTATEEALAGDGPAARAGVGTVVRLVCVSFAGGAGRATTAQFAYRVDPPHRFLPLGPTSPLSGVVAIAVLADGRLLVLERSAGFGVPPFENRIYIADTAEAGDVSDVERDLADWQGRGVTKRLVWRGGLGCNLEGLAVGPELPAGGQAVVAVADGGDPGVPGRLVGFRLTSP